MAKQKIDFTQLDTVQAILKESGLPAGMRLIIFRLVADETQPVFGRTLSPSVLMQTVSRWENGVGPPGSHRPAQIERRTGIPAGHWHTEA